MPDASDHDAPKRLSTMGEIRTMPSLLRNEGLANSGLQQTPASLSLGRRS